MLNSTIWVRTTDGNEFTLYDNGVSIVPNVSATVNGYYANVIKAYDQDPSRVIVVEYDFGMCNDSVIENITVVDVTEPVACVVCVNLAEFLWYIGFGNLKLFDSKVYNNLFPFPLLQRQHSV